MSLCLGRVAVVDVASHETIYIGYCNSSMGEPGGIRRLMKRGNCDILMRLCCEFAYSISLNETGGESPQVCCKRKCSIL